MVVMTQHQEKLLSDIHARVFDGLSENVEESLKVGKANQKGIDTLTSKFQVFLETREHTCPWAAKKVQDRANNWSLVQWLVMAGIGALAAVGTFI
jgi:hypothetical protein